MSTPNHSSPHVAPWPKPDASNGEICKAAETALLVQDACNLTAVLGTWARLRGSHYGNPPPASAHPVDVLFLSKVASLMTLDASSIGGVTLDGADVFAPAYEWCNAVAGKGAAFVIPPCKRCGHALETSGDCPNCKGRE